MHKIAIATGGTGGHIHPAVQVAEEFRRQEFTVIFMGSLGQAEAKIRSRGFEIENYELAGSNFKSLMGLFRFLSLMFSGFIEALRFLKENKIRGVVGFGGYGSFPVVLAAVVLRIPTMIHEQNVVPGKANRFLAILVNKIAVSFKETQKYFSTNKAFFSGCPTHLQIKDLDRIAILKKNNLEANVFTILIMGGSQGSHAVNQCFLDAVKSLNNNYDFQFIHLSGKKDFEDLKDKYKSIGARGVVYSSVDAMDELYSVADLVISRSGALTLTEVGLFGLPCILIPYPYAHGHQKENALVFNRAGTAVVIDEKDVNTALLLKNINEFKKLNFSRDIIKDKLKGVVVPEAALLIVQEMKRLV